MKKNFLGAVLLASGMLCSSAPLNASAINLSSAIYSYDKYIDHIEITGFLPTETKKYASQTITIPQEIDGLPVTVIGEMAFCNEQFSGVVLPDTLTAIKSQAFKQCSNLAEVQLPDNLQTLEYGAFEQNPSLKTITIPEHVTEIGDRIFYGCTGLESVKLPSGMTVIPDNMFQFCSSLQPVTFPPHVTTIGKNAFEGCLNFQELVIPDSVTELKANCFSACQNLETVKLPDSLTTMETGAFFNCRKLKNFEIPHSIKNLTFNVCMFTNLEDITIPEQVESVDYFALGWCENLKSVTFLNPNCKIIDDGCAIFNLSYQNQFEFGGVIYGYEGSTAQKYAEKYGYTFRPIGSTFFFSIAGDVSGDGKLSIVDVIQVRKGILSGQALPKNGDMNNDNVVNVIDLALLKQALLQQK